MLKHEYNPGHSPIRKSPEDQSRILVVDDEPTLRMGFRLALLTEGHPVDLARDGEEALAQLDRHPYALMILDLRMPGIDGIGVLRHLRHADTLVPTVIASAHMDDAVVQNALRLGAVDFLSKPVRPRDLREITRFVLAEEELFTAENEAMPEPVGEARCLLRRGHPGQALDALRDAPSECPAVALWRRVARLARPGGDQTPSVSLPDLVRWYPATDGER